MENPRELLEKVKDLAIEDLMATSDEELLQEAKEDGEDVLLISRRVKKAMLKAIGEQK